MSLLRRRLRGPENLESVGVKVELPAEQEYHSDSTFDRCQHSSSMVIHNEEDSSPSDFDTATDTGEESDEVVATSASPERAPDISGVSVSSASVLQNSRDAEDAPEPVVNKAWYDFDLSVLVALAPSIGNWLTGGDHIKNLLLILLLVFYLHQIIEIPWSLYLLSRPRCKPFSAPDQNPSVEDQYNRKAASELRFLEFFCLFLTILSPFLGALLLRTAVASVLGLTSTSWFDTSLFVLATGIRPWKHAVERLRKRATDLHDVIHYPPSEIRETRSQVETLAKKLTQLEAELKEAKDQLKMFTAEIHEHVEDAIDIAERNARRQDKRSEVARSTHEMRLMRLEQSVESLMEGKEIRADGPGRVSTYSSALMDTVYPILPTWAITKFQGKPITSPRLSPRLARSRSMTRLETIPEVAAFQPNSSRSHFSFLRIPGFDLVLRIGNLATLPIRCIVSCFLSGRLYTSQRPV